MARQYGRNWRKIAATALLPAMIFFACKKVHYRPILTPMPNNVAYYIGSIQSDDGAQYRTIYYYDGNYRLLGFRTDSLDDTIFYTNGSHVFRKMVTHLKPAPPLIAAGQVDTFAYSYDTSGHFITACLAFDPKTGVFHTMMTYSIDNNNQLASDTAFVPPMGTDSIISHTNYTFYAGNVVQDTVYFNPAFSKPYLMTTDTIATVVDSFSYDMAPSLLSALSLNTRIVMGIYDAGVNNPLLKKETAFDKTLQPLFSNTSTHSYTYDTVSKYPVTDVVTATGNLAAGPYHLQFFYFPVPF